MVKGFWVRNASLVTFTGAWRRLPGEQDLRAIRTLHGPHGLVAAVTNGMAMLKRREVAGVEIPPRAQYTRMILAELQRLASHLLWLGTHALDLAHDTCLYTSGAEEILKSREYWGSADYARFRIGGLQYDLYDGFEQDCLKFCDYLPPKMMNMSSCSPRIASG